ncbi:MAG: hypothetical protein AB7L92_02625, partial [Alphaproteobacteria bacterium]
VAIFAVVALVFMVQKNKEPSTKLGNAVEDMADGVEDAAEELDPNRTTGEKVGDAIEDMGENIEDAAGN